MEPTTLGDDGSPCRLPLAFRLLSAQGLQPLPQTTKKDGLASQLPKVLARSKKAQRRKVQEFETTPSR